MSTGRWALFATLFASLIIGADALRLGLSKGLASTGRTKLLSVARRIVPSDESIYVVLRQSDPKNSRIYLNEAAQIAPHDADVLVDLATDEEVAGHGAVALHLLERAYRADARSATTWALANFFARHGDLHKLEFWSRKYLDLETQDSSALFRLAWRMEPNIDGLLVRFPPRNCSQLMQLSGVLVSDGDLDDAAVVEQRETHCLAKDVQKDVERFTSQLLSHDRARAAQELWATVRVAGQFPWAPLSANLLSNAEFSRPLTEEGFDWTRNRTTGIEAQQFSDEHSMQFRFTDSHPDQAILIYQPVYLIPFRAYSIRSRLSVGENDGRQFQWCLVELSTGRLVQPRPDRGSEQWLGDHLQWEFVAPETKRTLVLALSYQHKVGQPRDLGPVTLNQVSLRFQSNQMTESP